MEGWESSHIEQGGKVYAVGHGGLKKQLENRNERYTALPDAERKK